MSTPITSSSTPPKELIISLLATVENNIVPLTRNGVSTGSKLFGAAILSRSTLQPHSVATNNERLSPLLHGEINASSNSSQSISQTPQNDQIREKTVFSSQRMNLVVFA
jgi:tRNA(Arg) A34 adenosine deaminase TadA